MSARLHSFLAPLAVVAVLAMVGCGSVEDAADRCADNGGIDKIEGDLEGGATHDANGRVYCKDGTIVTYEGWNVSEVNPR